MSLPQAAHAELQAIFGAAFSTDARQCLRYSSDDSRRQAQPAAVAWPASHDQVLALVRCCLRHRLPLLARGSGTSTTGAAVPTAGGIVASFERMQRIIDIDVDNRIAVVEPGVLNGDLQAALAPRRMFWAPDPTSAALCTIGGNIACNAGGPRAVKYGATRDNVLALRAVSGAGASLRCGSATTKGATGYDLTHLLIGSEGTLAIVTEATLKLTPLAGDKRTLRATYRDVAAAARAVARIMAQPVAPCALEFLDDESLRLARAHGGEAIPVAGAMLLLEVDGETDSIDAAMQAVAQAAQGEGLIDLDLAATGAQVEALWVARRALSPALRTISPHKINEDVVVPVSRLPALVAATRELAQRHRLPIVCFGHAGNGNLHVNLLPRDDAERERAVAALDGLFAAVIELGGTLSGEHGIGLAKRDFMPRAIDAATLDLMRAIKAQFDPAGILNPGKLLPAA